MIMLHNKKYTGVIEMNEESNKSVKQNDHVQEMLIHANRIQEQIMDNNASAGDHITQEQLDANQVLLDQWKDILDNVENVQDMNDIDLEIDQKLLLADEIALKIEENFLEMGNTPSQEQLDANQKLLDQWAVTLDEVAVAQDKLDAKINAAEGATVSTSAAGKDTVDEQTQKQQQETNARLALDTVGLDNVDLDLGDIDVGALLNAFVASIINGDNMMDAFKNSVSQVASDMKNKGQDAETSVADANKEKAPAEAKEELAEAAPAEEEKPAQEEPKSYVNEGQGPLLTGVTKPEDPQISPLVAIAMGQDVPDGQNILSGVFASNADNQIGDANVTQISFRPEPTVVDPSVTPMQIAEVTAPAANAQEFDQSAPKAMGLGS